MLMLQLICNVFFEEGDCLRVTYTELSRGIAELLHYDNGLYVVEYAIDTPTWKVNYVTLDEGHWEAM